jgi:Ser-tRNA(Ala) deacylase AlaX
VTIFGISLLDNFGIGYLQLFLREIRFVTGNIIDYLTNTHFYKYLTKLFSREDEASSKETNKNGSMMESNIRETTRNEENIRENYRTSKISEIIRGEEIKAEDESKSNNNKYYIIVGVLIASALV